MEKLIKLLNEYHHFNSDLIYYGWDKEYERVYFHTELPEEQKKKLAKAGIDDEGIDEQRVDNEWICSKKFGFIKWLVENNKIDLQPRHKIIHIHKGIDFESGKGIEKRIEVNDYEKVLMLLAISDTPIQDICVWLK